MKPWFVLGFMALSGCAVGPDFKRPEVAAPGAFRGQAQAGAASFADLAWWDVYRDDSLKDLIRAALSDGYDARIAAARVEQARSIAAEVHGQLFPGVGYGANADRGRNTILGQPFPGSTGATGNGFDAYLGVAWEFDLWGRVRRLDEAARAQYLASEEVRRGVLLSLVSRVATSYFELLELDEQLAIAHRSTTAFGESLDLFSKRLNGGVASRLDTASAEAAQASSEAQVPALEQQIAIKENEICVLIGRSPGPIRRGTSLADQIAAPDVPSGLPSALLERRPDIREAEAAARAANANIGVTVGGFLPRIGLSAIFGGVGTQLQSITSRSGGLWSIGADVSGPIFQGGTLRGQYTAAKSAWEAAKLQYEQTALNAFGEVADALVSREKLAAVRASQERAVAANEEAVKVATQRYTAGRAAYFEVLQAQELLYPAEVALAQTRRDQLTEIVQLYMALGGGWNLADAKAWNGK